MKVQHDGHEHEFEPEFGLPEPLPRTEQLLWQGAPDWRRMARDVFHIRKVAVYFALLLVWQVVSALYDGAGARAVLVPLAWMTALAATCLGLLAALAWLTARTSVYTLTDRRVVMRVGVVLTLTFNLPHRQIAAANLRLNADGSGDIPLVLAGDATIAYPHLWPHARPWALRRPEPMLRCLPDAQAVAARLTTAWQAAQVDPLAVRVAAPVSVAAPSPSPMEPVAMLPLGRGLAGDPALR